MCSRLAELQRVFKASLLYIERSISQILSVMENAWTKNSLASNNAQENGVPFLSVMGSCFGVDLLLGSETATFHLLWKIKEKRLNLNCTERSPLEIEKLIIHCHSIMLTFGIPYTDWSWELQVPLVNGSGCPDGLKTSLDSRSFSLLVTGMLGTEPGTVSMLGQHLGSGLHPSPWHRDYQRALKDAPGTQRHRSL